MTIVSGSITDPVSTGQNITLRITPLDSRGTLLYKLGKSQSIVSGSYNISVEEGYYHFDYKSSENSNHWVSLGRGSVSGSGPLSIQDILGIENLKDSPTFSLSALTNVTISDPQDNEVLTYVDGVWINQDVSAISASTAWDDITGAPDFVLESETSSMSVENADTASYLTPQSGTNTFGIISASAVALSGNITSTNGIKFNSVTAPSYLQGRLFFDSEYSTLSYYNDVSGVDVKIGQESIMKVRNNSGATISAGRAVYISGAVGNLPTIALASSNGPNGDNTVGLVHTAIANNANGYVIISGVASDLDTSAFDEGDILYLSTAGTISNVEPSFPSQTHHVRIGYCIRSHPTEGRILISLQKINELEELFDVIGDPSDNDTLVYQSGTGWTHSSIVPSASVALNTPPQESASYALTASYALNGGGASFDGTASYVDYSDVDNVPDFVLESETSSMSVLSSSYASTASRVNWTDSVEIGNGAVSLGSYSVSVGTSAISSASADITIGWNSLSNSNFDIRIGSDAGRYGNVYATNPGTSIAIGRYAGQTGLGVGSVAIGERAGDGEAGYGVGAMSQYSVFLGHSAGFGFRKNYSILIGNGAGLDGAKGDHVIAIGRSTSSPINKLGERSISLGYLAKGEGYDSIAFGSSTLSNQSGSIAIGANVFNKVSNTAELGIWPSSGSRGAGIRVDGSGGLVTLSLPDRASAYTDGGTVAGNEATNTLPRDSWGIRRNNADILFDYNKSGTIRTLNLTTSSYVDYSNVDNVPDFVLESETSSMSVLSSSYAEYSLTAGTATTATNASTADVATSAVSADTATSASYAATIQDRLLFVNHGSNASTARPNASIVYWVGSVEPTNAINADLWFSGSYT